MTELKQTPGSKNVISRRRFLALLTHGAWLTAMGAVMYQIGRFLGPTGLESGQASRVAGGSLQDFPPQTTIYVPEARAWVHHGADELVALDAVCPHLGCLVQQKGAGSGFRCPCHGSEFGADGELERGPAQQPLRQLDIQTHPDNTITITT